MTKQLSDLRDVLRQTMNELLEEGPVSNREIISRVKLKHPNVVRAASDDLLDSGLLRQLNNITNRRFRLPDQSGTDDLFREIGGLPELFSVKAESGAIKKEKFGKVKLSQLIQGIEKQSQSNNQKRQRILAERLRILAEKVGTVDLTFDDALSALEDE